MNKEMFISHDDITIIDALKKIDVGGRGILYIINKEQQLEGSVSDGDIRRWIMKSNNLEEKITKVMNVNPKFLFKTDIINPISYIKRHSVTSIPILDRNRKIYDIIFINGENELSPKRSEGSLEGIPVVIMAGGKGTRLYPFTKILPKPLIPIGDIPIVERIIVKFLEYGVSEFFLTVNYKKGMIKAYFSDLMPDYQVTYIEEEKPLGTGGSLKLIRKKLDKPLFVTNCDTLIETDYNDLYAYHIEAKNDITIVSSLKNVTIPYGVLECSEGGNVIKLKEKPNILSYINTGMYIINPEMIELIPDNTFYHMTHLVEEALNQKLKVGMYPISGEAFLDMGELEEMKHMEEKLKVKDMF